MTEHKSTVPRWADHAFYAMLFIFAAIVFGIFILGMIDTRKAFLRQYEQPKVEQRQ